MNSSRLSLKIILILITVSFPAFLIVLKKPNQIAQSALINPPSPTVTPAIISPTPLPITKLLHNDYHVYQTFNNCGPAALSMALSYYGHSVSQQVLGQKLRPFQNPQGDNDDKSTTLEELAIAAQNYNLIPYHRPAGDTQIVKRLLALDLPVITRTLLKTNEDIGHYRVIKGYDDSRQIFIQDDSLQGNNLEYSYTDFDRLWQTYNYEFLVLAPTQKLEQVESTLGELVDPIKAWQKAKTISTKRLEQNPDNFIAQFNRSVASYHLGEFQQSIADFEAVQSKLPMRHLWYQIEPIQAYFELKEYQKVLSLTRQILDNHNRAFSELYLIRGQTYQNLNQPNQARFEYNQAILYNANFTAKIPQI